MKRLFCLIVALLSAPAAWAHPHVFVQVSLKLDTNAQGQLTGVEVTWTYDQLFSLLIMSDQDILADGSAGLSEADRAALKGFDLVDWQDGFEGALFLYQKDQKIALRPPEALDVMLDARGRLVTRHRRAVAPIDLGETLVIQPYDPYYYAALSLMQENGLPDGCTGTINHADAEAADAVISELGWTGFGDEAVFNEVKIGIYFADTLEVTCAGS